MKNNFSKSNLPYSESRTPSSGFTLIEVMIAVGLFTVVMVVGIGAVLNVNMTYKKTQKMRTLIDNMGFIMEDMTRSIRTGSLYHCPTLDPAQTTSAMPSTDYSIPCDHALSIVFQPSSSPDTSVADNQYAYILSYDSDPLKGSVYKFIADGTSHAGVLLSPSEIFIDTTRSGFTIIGADPTDLNNQPRVIINLEGEIKYKDDSTPFALQTTVVSRMPKVLNVINP